MMSENDSRNSAFIDKTVLKIIQTTQDVMTELHPGWEKSVDITLDSSLDRDLGFDSLGKVELLSRLEHSLKVMFPEQVLTNAQTPRDLLRHILIASTPDAAPSILTASNFIDNTIDAVDNRDASTLVEVLQRRVLGHHDRTHIIFYSETDDRQELTYRELMSGAEAVAAGLQNSGLLPGQSVAIMLPSNFEYFFSFLGILLAGGIPVPLYPPVRAAQIEEHLNRHRKILSNCQAAVMITIAEVKPLARLLKAHVSTLRDIVTVSGLNKKGRECTIVTAKTHDTAFLQYTSGSTGNPKGVVLTHANLLANIRAMGEVTGAGFKDVFVSWLPLYHDMGLIGAWMGSLYYGAKLVLMSPFSFLIRPERWLWAIHRQKGTLSASPNFGYELCLNRIDHRDIEGLDLSSWRIAFNGAEPVSPETIKTFPQHFAVYGFRPEAMTPVYGLAESSVGLAFPVPGRGPLIDRVQRGPFMKSGKAVVADKSDDDALSFVACGRPLPGHQIRIVDSAGNETGSRQEGRLLFKGPSTTSGYFRNTEATRSLFHGEWLDSGDLAYEDGGEIFLTGRVKDIIIKSGRNIYPHELEEAVGRVEGIRKGCVAVFGSRRNSTTEQLIILAETRKSDPADLERMRGEIVNLTVDLLQMPPDEVLLEKPHTVLKTSSGKLRRAATKDLYEKGLAGKKNRAIWLQVIRLILSGIVPQLKNWLYLLGKFIYITYSWALFILIAFFAWIAAVILPGADLRWKTLRGTARLLARLVGISIISSGLENIPDDRPVIMAANHQSYLDSFVLMAVLPLRFSFIAKAELKKNFMIRTLLSRMDVEFVERFDPESGVSDSKRIIRAGLEGRSFLFFPEGTFHRLPGLLPFHMGAFTTAIRSRCPIVPIIIRGTRTILPSGTWIPHRAVVKIDIGEPVSSSASDWSSAVRLRDKVRTLILDRLGETDLDDTKTPLRRIIPKK